MARGIFELVCAAGLIVPALFHWQPMLTVVAVTILAMESVVFIGVHMKCREIGPIVMSVVLGVVMAFVACGRMVLQPILCRSIVLLRRLNTLSRQWQQGGRGASPLFAFQWLRFLRARFHFLAAVVCESVPGDALAADAEAIFAIDMAWHGHRMGQA